jgi:hypothetical protein
MKKLSETNRPERVRKFVRLVHCASGLVDDGLMRRDHAKQWLRLEAEQMGLWRRYPKWCAGWLGELEWAAHEEMAKAGELPSRELH